MKNRTHIFATILVGVTCLALLPMAQAVVPAPDGGYPGGNTAEGQAALLSRTTGIYNTGVGLYSLLSLTDGNFCTGVGAGALLANTADGNTAIGAGALLTNTNGQGNTADGEFALFNNNGFNNTATGAGALQNNTTADSNTAKVPALSLATPRAKTTQPPAVLRSFSTRLAAAIRRPGLRRSFLIPLTTIRPMDIRLSIAMLAASLTQRLETRHCKLIRAVAATQPWVILRFITVRAEATLQSAWAPGPTLPQATTTYTSAMWALLGASRIRHVSALRRRHKTQLSTAFKVRGWIPQQRLQWEGMAVGSGAPVSRRAASSTTSNQWTKPAKPSSR